MRRNPGLACVVGILLLAASCGREKLSDLEERADRSFEGVAAAADVKFIAQVFAGGLRGVTADTAPQYVQAAHASIDMTLKSAFSGCVTVTSGASSLQAVFTCGGPAGLFTIEGTVSAVIRPTLEGTPPHVAVTGTKIEITLVDFTIGGREVGGGMTVSYTPDPQSADVELDIIVETGRVGSVGVTAEPAISFAGTCTTLDGALTLTVAGSAAVDVTATGYERCRDGCPAQGGSIEAGAGDLALTITFDGTGTAQVTGAGGRTATLDLMCEG